jgi:hypothetical protein
MGRRALDGQEWPHDRELRMTRDAGIDGAGVRFFDPAFAREVTGFRLANGMTLKAQCYPQGVADSAPVLELLPQLPADHINLRPDGPEGCIPLLEGRQRPSAEAGIPVHVETHRGRRIIDLFLALQLLDCLPELRLTASLPNYLVGREFP